MAYPTSFPVTVAATATPVVTADDQTEPHAFLIRNTHATLSVWVGDATVTTSTGYEVKAGEAISGGLLPTVDEPSVTLYAVAASNVVVQVLDREVSAAHLTLRDWKTGRVTPWNLIPASTGTGPDHGIPAGGTTGQVLAKSSGTDFDADWADETGGGGAVSSVNAKTGIVVLAASDVGAQPVDSDLTAIAALSTTAFGRGFLVLADAAAARTALTLGTAATSASSAFDAAGAAAAAQAASQPVDSDLTAIAALSTTTFGRALLALADAAAARTALGLGTAAVAATTDFDAVGAAAAAQAASQPVDSDLTAIAALATTAFGRSILTQADAAATRTTLGLGTAATQASSAFDAAGAAASAQAASQPVDSDLTAIAALTTTTFGRAFLALADAAATRTAIGTVIGTDVEAHDADLTAIAALSPANDDFVQRKAGAWTNRTVAQVATDIVGSATGETIIRQQTLDQMAAPAADVDMASHKLKNVADATVATDALNRQSGDARYPLLGNVTVDVQAFTSGSGNWTKPANALWVIATIVGAGAGGGSGRCGATSSERHGGSGGGAGGVVDVEFAASDLGTTEAYVVGAGGAGGAQAGTAAADGSNGGVGNSSSFASVTATGGSILSISGGSKGTSTDPATACPGGQGTRSTQLASTTLVAASGGLALIAAGTAGTNGTSGNTPGAGGAGGSITAANALIAAKNGGTGGSVGLTAGTAGAPGGSGTAPTRKDHVGPGGGGGSGSTSTSVDGSAGGAGLRGGGGGGGGAGTSGGTAKSGAGGAGGDGYVLVVTFCAR